MNTLLKNIAFWALIILAVLFFYKFLSANRPDQVEISFSDFMSQVEAQQIAKVTITGSEIAGDYKQMGPDGQPKRFTTYAPDYNDLVKDLRKSNITIEARKPKESTYLVTILSWLPMLVLIGIWIFFMRQMQSGGNKALSFGKSKARLSSSQAKKVTFKDVAGVDEAKEELEEIIEFLKEPQKFQKLGGKIPKGVLLMGPPGTGKTLLARAISGEANVPFFSISGSDFVEMFVGVGASRVRDLFEQGKKNAPCIIFIDEIDAVGRHRGAGLGGGHDEREQTLNQLLVEMDGFESNDGVILIAATNRPDVLDPALLRPGRFDRRVVVARPDVKGREEIFKVHTRKIPLSDDVDLAVLARATPGFSGADLANLVNEAALNAARYSKKVVAMEDFETSKDKVLMGSERRSLIISEKEKRLTAYHEAGHALVAYFMPHADPIHKVTIIPRGMALGVTQQLPIDDRHNYEHAVGDDGRAGVGADVHGGPHDRGGGRSREGDGHGPPDGVRVGHDRGAGPAHLRQEGRADLPRAGDRPAPGLQRGHGGPDRSGGQAALSRGLRAGEAGGGKIPPSPGPGRGGPARVRGPRRRGSGRPGEGGDLEHPRLPQADEEPPGAGAPGGASGPRGGGRASRPRHLSRSDQTAFVSDAGIDFPASRCRSTR